MLAEERQAKKHKKRKDAHVDGVPIPHLVRQAAFRHEDKGNGEREARRSRRSSDDYILEKLFKKSGESSFDLFISFINFVQIIALVMPGAGLMVRVVGLGSEGPEFKSCLAVELIPGGVDSACHPSEVGKVSTSLLG